MVDIHTHLLPGIDDGARDWEDVYEMAAMAADSGVDALVCTHHSNLPDLYDNYNSRRLDRLFYELCERLRQGDFPLRILRGMEIFATPDICKKIRRGELLPINGTNYFLVEFAFEESPDYMKDLLFDMKRQNMNPVVAHPERYQCLKENPSLLFDWREKGILAQINKGSLLGKFGIRAERAAWTFIEHNMAACVASDAHRPYKRTTHMGEIKRFLTNHFSEQTAWALLEENPRRIVEGKRIDRI